MLFRWLPLGDPSDLDKNRQVMEEIFDDCRDLVQSAVDGHNVTVMTYGQTGLTCRFVEVG